MDFLPHIDATTILILAFACGVGISDAIAKSRRLKPNGVSQLLCMAFSAAAREVLVEASPITRKVAEIAESQVEEIAGKMLEKPEPVAVDAVAVQPCFASGPGPAPGPASIPTSRPGDSGS